MLNKIILMGRLTRDPELRHTQSGTAVASFSLAVDRDFKSRDSGEKTTDFIDVVAWRNTAEFVSKYFAKGRMAVAEGRLQIRDWTDKEGGKRRYRAKLRLTEAGRSAAERMTGKIRQAVQRGGRGLTDGQREDFYRALGVIARNLEQICSTEEPI